MIRAQNLTCENSITVAIAREGNLEARCGSIAGCPLVRLTANGICVFKFPEKFCQPIEGLCI